MNDQICILEENFDKNVPERVEKEFKQEFLEKI